MSNKIKILFEELSKKYPEIVTAEFVNKVTEAVDELVEAEAEQKFEKMTEEEKTKIREEALLESGELSEAAVEKLVDTLDVYTENAMTEFVEEHGEKIEKSIRTNVSADLVEKISEVLCTHGALSEEAALDKSAYEETIEKANRTISNLMESNEQLRKDGLKRDAIAVVDQVCEGMSYENTLKFYELIEDYSVDDIDSFRSKIESLAAVFEGKDEDDDDEEDKGEKVDKGSVKGGEEEDDDDEEDDSFMSKLKKNLGGKKDKDGE